MIHSCISVVIRQMAPFLPLFKNSLNAICFFGVTLTTKFIALLFFIRTHFLFFSLCSSTFMIFLYIFIVRSPAMIEVSTFTSFQLRIIVRKMLACSLIPIIFFIIKSVHAHTFRQPYSYSWSPALTKIFFVQDEFSTVTCFFSYLKFKQSMIGAVPQFISPYHTGQVEVFSLTLHILYLKSTNKS